MPSGGRGGGNCILPKRLICMAFAISRGLYFHKIWQVISMTSPTITTNHWMSRANISPVLVMLTSHERLFLCSPHALVSSHGLHTFNPCLCQHISYPGWHCVIPDYILVIFPLRQVMVRRGGSWNAGYFPSSCDRLVVSWVLFSRRSVTDKWSGVTLESRANVARAYK